MSNQPVCRCALAVLLLVAACDSNLTIPGFIRPGANRPPLISQSGVSLDSAGQLRLSAAVLEPDGDGLTVSYEQLAGPFAVQRNKVQVGGLLSVMLDPTGGGLHVFRVHASDGFFDTTADVSIDVPVAPAAAPNRGLLSPNARALPSGRFNVHITGQVMANKGLASFALTGELQIDPLPANYLGDNVLIVSLQTIASPNAAAAPPGALLLQSASSTPSGLLDDLLNVQVTSSDIVLTGPADDVGLLDGAPVRFRTAETRSGPFGVAAVLLRIRLSGDDVTGEIFVGSRAPAGDLRADAEYQAQFTGTRAR